MALRGGGWRVLPLACHEIGMLLTGRKPEYPSHPMQARPEQAILAEAVVAAMCHRTNWDRLRSFVLSRFESNPSEAEWLRESSDADFTNAYRSAFSSSVEGQDNREDLLARHRIAAAVAQSFAKDGFGIIAGPKNLRLQGADGLLMRLRTLEGFSEDPEGKKLRVFAQNLVRFRLVEFVDEESLPPAIEYHIMRLYLRSGRVIPETPSAHESLVSARPRRIDSVNHLRRSVAEAMRITALSAGMRIIELNDLEWHMGRALCVRGQPLCDGPPLPNKPLPASIAEDDEGCPLRTACSTFQGQVPFHWQEPQLHPQHANLY